MFKVPPSVPIKNRVKLVAKGEVLVPSLIFTPLTQMALVLPFLFNTTCSHTPGVRPPATSIRCVPPSQQPDVSK